MWVASRLTPISVRAAKYGAYSSRGPRTEWDGMGLLDKLLIGGGVAVAGIQAIAAYSEAQETKRRKSCPLSFNDGLTQSDFVEIARDVAKGTTRVGHVAVTGVTVTLHVRSNSGLSTWTAEVDFNDYGRVTGAYWLKTDTDSIVPKHFAEAVKKRIEGRRRSAQAAR
jgi:hypothetical protein